MEPPFEQLRDPDAFEQLCYDLLDAEGFRALSWRGPSADGGRDIEAIWQTVDPTGNLLHTRWYIECKWYTDTLSFSEIEPKLLAATAARVDYLLIMTSSRVRNTAIDRTAEWLQSRGNPFRVRYWIGTELIRLCVKHSQVYQKHFPHLAHPGWGNAAAELQRARSLVSIGSERVHWRILPAITRLSGVLAAETTKSPLLNEIASELELLSGLLRGHEFSSQPSTERASSRNTELSGMITFALERVSRRVRTSRCILAAPLQTCDVAVSRPLFVCAVFELALNAALYSSDSTFGVELQTTDTHWELRLVNRSTEVRLPDWPVVGYRGSIARTITASGQGLGCWVASEAARKAGFTIDWSIAQGTWTVEVRGARGVST